MTQKPDALEAAIIGELDSSGFQDDFMVLHARSDVPDLMKAMDVMIFPSHMEGLGNVAVEAQLAGIHCLMSEGVPEAAAISNYADRMSLSQSPEDWAKRAVVMCEDTAPIEYTDYEAWDMRKPVTKLLRYYREAVQG